MGQRAALQPVGRDQSRLSYILEMVDELASMAETLDEAELAIHLRASAAARRVYIDRALPISSEAAI